MTKTRRIIHHACWFALLGPHIGVLVTLAGEMQSTTLTLGQFLLEILSILPIFIVLTWVIGGVPALLTGIAMACLPPRIYACVWQRVLICGAIGAAIASIVWLVFIGAMDEALIWMSVGPGLMAGMMMGWIVPSLPFRGETTQTYAVISRVNTQEPDR